jgi:hypothetical protein
MPALKHLYLHLNNPNGMDDPTDLVLAPHHFPCLTHVELLLQSEVSQVSLPWSQLISFKVTSSKWSSWRSTPHFDPYSIIHLLLRVEYLELTYKGTTTASQFEPGAPSLTRGAQANIVLLPRLHTLRLNWPLDATGRCTRASGFLQSLSAPLLETMILGGSGNGAWACDVLMHTSRFPSLVTLNAELWMDAGSEPKKEAIVGSLHSLVNLEKFTCSVLDDSGFSNLVLEELGKSGRNRGEESTYYGNASKEQLLFPRLQSLDLRNVSVKDTLQVLRDFASGRISCVAVDNERKRPLRTVFIDCEVDEEGIFGDPKVVTVSPLHYNDKMTELRIKGNFNGKALNELISLGCANTWCVRKCEFWLNWFA